MIRNLGAVTAETKGQTPGQEDGGLPGNSAR